jgi:uncharacterized membrane protein (UPF0127 family)
MQRVNIRRRATGDLVLPNVRWCASFGCKLRGFMFRRGLAPGEALLMVESRDSVSLTSIHMFFVPFELGVVWINTAGRVVDKVVARPWRPYYASRAPARYTLELAPELVEQVSVGDEWDFERLAPAAAG